MATPHPNTHCLSDSSPTRSDSMCGARALPFRSTRPISNLVPSSLMLLSYRLNLGNRKCQLRPCPSYSSTHRRQRVAPALTGSLSRYLEPLRPEPAYDLLTARVTNAISMLGESLRRTWALSEGHSSDDKYQSISSRPGGNRVTPIELFHSRRSNSI